MVTSEQLCKKYRFYCFPNALTLKLQRYDEYNHRFRLRLLCGNGYGFSSRESHSRGLSKGA